MLRRTGSILFLIFSSCYLYAQPGVNPLPVFSKVSSFELLDAKLQKNIRIYPDDKPLSLFIFLSPECPLCQNYTKTLNELNKKFGPQLHLYGIVPGNAYTVTDISAFAGKYHTEFAILIDAKQRLTHYLEAAVTPQAILLDKKGNLIYSGAIDDWVQGLGKKKNQVTENYLLDAIAQSLNSGFVKIKTTKAFGCKINDY